MGVCCPHNHTLESQTLHQHTLNLNEFDKNTNADNGSISYVSYSTFNQLSSITISLKTLKSTSQTIINMFFELIFLSCVLIFYFFVDHSDVFKVINVWIYICNDNFNNC